MSERVHLILVVVLWASLLRHLTTVRWHPHTTAQRSTCLAIGLFAAAMTLLYPPVYLAVDRWTGVPNVSRLLANCLGVGSGWAISPVREQALRQRHQRSLLGSSWLLAATIAIMTALFVAAPVDESAPGNFAARYSDSPAVIGYRLVLMLYVGSVMGQLCYAGWRVWHPTSTIAQRWIRLRSQLQTIGWGCGAAYALHEAIYPVANRVGVALPQGVHGAIQYTLLGGFVVLLLGSGFIGIGHFLLLYRAFRRLYPLWSTVYTLVPSVANNSPYPPPRSALADALTMTDLPLRTYSRISEIQDGLLVLRPYADRAAVDRARALCRQAGITGDEAAAIVEATTLAAATAAPQAAPAPDALPPAQSVGDTDLDHERRHFERVTRAYRHSPIVKASVAVRPTGAASGVRQAHTRQVP